MYLDVMGKVYDLTLKELIRQIQRLSDITMDDSEKLNELLDIFRDCDDMFDNILPDKPLEVCDFFIYLIKYNLIVWSKYQYLSKY